MTRRTVLLPGAIRGVACEWCAALDAMPGQDLCVECQKAWLSENAQDEIEAAMQRALEWALFRLEVEK